MSSGFVTFCARSPRIPPIHSGNGAPTGDRHQVRHTEPLSTRVNEPRRALHRASRSAVRSAAAYRSSRHPSRCAARSDRSRVPSQPDAARHRRRRRGSGTANRVTRRARHMTRPPVHGSGSPRCRLPGPA